jgi:uncharacterized surface protein with fasciclin (FAS1) repeats
LEVRFQQKATAKIQLRQQNTTGEEFVSKLLAARSARCIQTIDLVTGFVDRDELYEFAKKLTKPIRGNSSLSTSGLQSRLTILDEFGQVLGIGILDRIVSNWVELTSFPLKLKGGSLQFTTKCLHDLTDFVLPNCTTCLEIDSSELSLARLQAGGLIHSQILVAKEFAIKCLMLDQFKIQFHRNRTMTRVWTLALALMASMLLLPAFAADAPKDIVGVAQEAGSFKTLCAALEAADLVGALQGEGPFTVFAPTDEAFAKLPAGTVEGLLKDKAKLAAILKYHVVSGKVMAADVVKLKEAKTLNGKAAPIKVEGGTVMVAGSKVTKTDIAAKNGVIHVIDTVMLP